MASGREQVRQSEGVCTLGSQEVADMPMCLKWGSEGKIAAQKIISIKEPHRVRLEDHLLCVRLELLEAFEQKTNTV